MGGTITKEVSTVIMATSYAIYKKEITDYLKNVFMNDKYDYYIKEEK